MIQRTAKKQLHKGSALNRDIQEMIGPSHENYSIDDVSSNDKKDAFIFHQRLESHLKTLGTYTIIRSSKLYNYILIDNGELQTTLTIESIEHRLTIHIIIGASELKKMKDPLPTVCLINTINREIKHGTFFVTDLPTIIHAFSYSYGIEDRMNFFDDVLNKGIETMNAYRAEILRVASGNYKAEEKKSMLKSYKRFMMQLKKKIS